MLKLTILLALLTFGFAQEDDNLTKILNLSDQGITSLNEYDFSKYPLLEELDLSNNNIEYIKEDALTDNPQIKKLTLSGNKNLKLPEFSTLLISEIEELSLTDCNIQVLPANIFDGLINLKIVDLSNNPLDENGIQVSTLLAIMSPEKIILPAVHEAMIKEICDQLDITIGIKSEGYSDSIKCADVREGTWQNLPKEQPSQEIEDNQMDEEIHLDGENQIEPEDESEDDINVEIKRQANPGPENNPEENIQPEPATGENVPEPAVEENENKPEGEEENIEPPAAENQDNLEPAPAVEENENKPEEENIEPPAAENQDNLEPAPAVEENENKPEEENIEPPAAENQDNLEPAPAVEENENKPEEENIEPSAAENQDNLEPAPAVEENENKPEEENIVPPPAENQDNLEPAPSAGEENKPEGEEENKNSLEPEASAPEEEIHIVVDTENQNPSETENKPEPENKDNPLTRKLEPTGDEIKPEDTQDPTHSHPEEGVPDAIDGKIVSDAVDGKRTLANENPEEKPKEGDEPLANQRGIAGDSVGPGSSRSSLAKAAPEGETKVEASSSGSSTGTTVLVVLVIAVVVAGAAAFGYKFYKTRTYQAARSTEPIERELKEIVIAKNTNGSSSTPKSPIEEEPLMERLENNVEVKEINETNQKENTASSSNNNGPFVPTTTPIKPPHLNKNDDKTEI